MECNIKTKNSDDKNKSKTGGREATNVFNLYPIEEKMSDMFGEVSIFGLSVKLLNCYCLNA